MSNTPKLVSITHLSRQLRGEVELPSSKSESNRLLILQALSKGAVTAASLSAARDTKLMSEALSNDALTIDIKDAGTTMRFLTAYYCAAGQHKIITGTPRMCERPIGILVEALRDIGFDIRYLNKASCPPLEIIPVDMAALKNEVNIAGDISSQYISALLMIAPVLPGGLTIHFTTGLSSRPYIELTLDLLQKAGIKYIWTDNNITIAHQTFSKTTITASSDWSAAGYWYSMAALADKADIKLKGLTYATAQGDKILATWMTGLGVETIEESDGLRLLSSTLHRTIHVSDRELHFDFTHYPDLAQTIIVLCAATGTKATFRGMQSLRIKETDRIAALQNELAKFGVRLYEAEKDVFTVSGVFEMSPQTIQTYDDHRMAMAFAPLAMLGHITIEDPDVVKKSYPAFWLEMKNAAFEMK